MCAGMQEQLRARVNAAMYVGAAFVNHMDIHAVAA